MNLFRNLVNKTILVVDDEEYNWLLIKDMFEDIQVNLIWAKVGQEAIDIVTSGKNIDLILMDMEMPILDGYDTTKEIKKIIPEIPVIAQTAYSMPEEIEKCFTCGCSGYISKPINFDELISLINDLTA